MAIYINGITIEGGAEIPSGVILLWSGAISAIPTGWVLCDGNNSTPNLTDRFVIHADADAAGTRNVGDTGGEHTHTLTIDEMPSHDHSYNNLNPFIGTANGDNVGNSSYTARTTGSKGGGAAHNNMPKFYALAYIMKS